MLAHTLDPQEFTSVFHVVKKDKAAKGKVKISAFKRLFGAFDQEALKRSEELVEKVEISLLKIREDNIDPEFVTTTKNDLNTLTPLFLIIDEMLDKELLSLFELDDKITDQIIENYFIIRDLALEIYEYVKLYHEIDIADKEFEEGKTISHEELFNDIL